MSASDKKKLRKALEAEKAAKSGDKNVSSSDRAFRSSMIIAGIVAVAVLALLVVYGVKRIGEKQHAKETVMTVGEYEIKVPEFNFFYRDNVVNALQSTILAYFVDSTKPLSEQSFYTDEYATYEDYFIDSTEKGIGETYNLYALAVESGCTLSEENQQKLESSLAEIKSYAAQNSRSNDGYVAALYGTGCTLEGYKQYQTVRLLASQYYDDNLPKNEHDDAALADYYQEHREDVDGVSFTSISYSASNYVEKNEDGTAKDVDDAAIAKAKADAEAALDSMPTDAVERTAITHDNIENYGYGTHEMAEWLFEDARKEGDTKLFTSEDGNTFYVAKFTSRDTRDYNTVNIRLISFTASSSSDSTDGSTPATNAGAAYETLNNNPTVDTFKELVKQYAPSNETEGLVENVALHQYADKVDEYIFSPERKNGDYELIENDGSYYLVWFEGVGENYRSLLCDNLMTQEEQTAWYDSVKAVLESKTTKAIRYAETDLTLQSN